MLDQLEIETPAVNTLRVVLTSKNGVYEASAVFAGEQVEVKSRHGAVLALARVAKERNAPDGPVEAYSPEGVLLLRYPSLHQAALYTIKETASGERMVKWSTPKQRFRGDPS